VAVNDFERPFNSNTYAYIGLKQ